MTTPSPRRARRTSAAILLLATVGAAEIAPDEGLVTRVYRDLAGINTYCYGETQNVVIGKNYTAAECKALLIKRVPDYMIPIDTAIPGLPDHRLIAYTRAGYNLGVGFIHWRKNKQPGTSIAELERNGHWQQACERMLNFDKVNGKPNKGVHNRRVREVTLCLHGWPQ